MVREYRLPSQSLRRRVKQTRSYLSPPEGCVLRIPLGGEPPAMTRYRVCGGAPSRAGTWRSSREVSSGRPAPGTCGAPMRLAGRSQRSPCTHGAFSWNRENKNSLRDPRWQTDTFLIILSCIRRLGILLSDRGYDGQRTPLFPLEIWINSGIVDRQIAPPCSLPGYAPGPGNAGQIVGFVIRAPIVETSMTRSPCRFGEISMWRS